jgi:hypothetical protein
MKAVKTLRDSIGESGSDNGNSRQDPDVAGRWWLFEQPSWEERRRQVCYPLARLFASLVEAMTRPACVVRRGVVLEHAPGTLNPTTWVDCLVVSPFGVFAVDQYDWTGRVKRSANRDELLLHERPGVVSVQTSPLRRGKPALRHLQALLSQHQCPVECVAVFSDSHCALDPALPENILQEADLRHFLRTRINRFCNGHSRYLDPERIEAHLQLHSADWGED